MAGTLSPRRSLLLRRTLTWCLLSAPSEIDFFFEMHDKILILSVNIFGDYRLHCLSGVVFAVNLVNDNVLCIFVDIRFGFALNRNQLTVV